MPDVDVRAKGMGCWRALVFMAVGGVSGFALALLCAAGCNASMGEMRVYAAALEQFCLAFAAVIGGFIGLVFGTFWRPKPPRRPDNE